MTQALLKALWTSLSNIKAQFKCDAWLACFKTFMYLESLIPDIEPKQGYITYTYLLHIPLKVEILQRFVGRVGGCMLANIT